MSELLKDATEISDADQEGNSSDRWMVSYANLMTLIFGFFFIYCFITIKDKFNQEQQIKMLTKENARIEEKDFVLEKTKTTKTKPSKPK